MLQQLLMASKVRPGGGRKMESQDASPAGSQFGTKHLANESRPQGAAVELIVTGSSRTPS